MLVKYEYSDGRYPVGIAVAQWKLDDELRMFVLYPISKEHMESFVEVEAVIRPEELEIISPAGKGWQDLGDLFGDESFGYPCNENVRQKLYDVWDEGSRSFPDAAHELFKLYKAIIHEYTPKAHAYFKASAEQDYNEQLETARANGWE